MASKNLPYSPSTLDSGAFQMWHYQPRQYGLVNRIDLRDTLSANFTTPNVDVTNRLYPFSLFQFMDGTALLKGRIVYTGIPTLTTTVVLADFSANEKMREAFMNLACVGEFFPTTIVASPLIDNTSWCARVRASFATSSLFDLVLQSNKAATSTLDTSELISLNLWYVPAPVEY